MKLTIINGFLTANHGAYSNLVGALKKAPSGSPGPVDFLAGQVTFKLTCPKGEVPGESSTNKIINQDEGEVTPGKGNVRANYPRDKLLLGTQNKDFGTVWQMNLTRSLVCLRCRVLDY